MPKRRRNPLDTYVAARAGHLVTVLLAAQEWLDVTDEMLAHVREHGTLSCGDDALADPREVMGQMEQADAVRCSIAVIRDSLPRAVAKILDCSEPHHEPVTAEGPPLTGQAAQDLADLLDN